MVKLTRQAIRTLLWPLLYLIRSMGGESAKQRKKANRLASTIVHELARLGFQSRNKKGQIRRVSYEYPLLLTRDELWLPINLSRFPQGKPSTLLQEEDTLQSLENRCHAPVRVDKLANGKLCLVVRMGGTAFPSMFSINKAVIPHEAPPLVVPFGINEQGEQDLVDIAELKHLLIAGATGGGKTTLMHSILSTVIGRNGPEDVELWLADMKRTEFNLYKPLLDKKTNRGIVRHLAVEPEDAVTMLDAAFKEIIRRNKLMESMDCVNIDDLARTTGTQLPRILVVVDEFAILTTDSTSIGKKSIGSWSQMLMTRIASLGRSAGVSIIIATQMVKKEVITRMILANFENRISFSTADWRESQLVISTSQADGLPTGRAIIRQDGKPRELQTCFITPQQVKLEVGRIVEFGPEGGLGDYDELAHFVKDAKLLLSVACDLYQGAFSRSKILQADGVRGVITQERFNDVAAKMERDGILTPGKGRNPRKVERAFYGRPGLLDTLYNLPSGSNSNTDNIVTTTPTPVKLLEEKPLLLEHHNAENTDPIEDDVVVCGLEKSDTHAADPEDEQPSWFTKAFEPEGIKPVETPKTIKRARRATPQRKVKKFPPV